MENDNNASNQDGTHAANPPGSLPRTNRLVLRLGKNALVLVPIQQIDEPEPVSDKFSQFLLGSPLAGTELNLTREATRERFIELHL